MTPHFPILVEAPQDRRIQGHGVHAGRIGHPLRHPTRWRSRCGLRGEYELGFKMVRWISAIEFVHDFSHLSAGTGGYNEDHDLYGYRMPRNAPIGPRWNERRPAHVMRIFGDSGEVVLG